MKTQAPLAQALYGTLFDNPFDGLAYCQMFFDGQDQPVDFVYVKVSKNFEKLTGLKEAEGKKVTELIPGIKTSNPELFVIYGRVSLTGQPEKFEVYIQPLARWFLVSVYSPQKKFFVAVFQNITDQKQMEQDLRNANVAILNVLEDIQVERETLAKVKAKDDAILASIGDGLVVVDKMGKILTVNSSFENLVGWTRKEVLGKLLVEVVPREDEAGNIVPFNERILTKILSTTTTTTTWYYIRKDKTRFPAASIITPFFFEGKIIGGIEVFRDITKEKEVDKAKSEFVSLASHQLRTPLGIIKWYLEAWKNEDYFKKSPQVIQGYFDEVYKSNERVLSLVRDLLSVSRIEQGLVKNDPKSVDLIALATEIVKQMQIMADKKQVVLHLTVQDPQILLISIDILRLHEVIENLIINAIEYTPALGKVEVIVGENNDMVTVSIQDTGMGISVEDKSKLFGKFFRASEAIKNNPEGSGLGLYVVKSYVEQWGGKISVESSEGKGSKFVVSLPISIDDGRG